MQFVNVEISWKSGTGLSHLQNFRGLHRPEDVETQRCFSQMNADRRSLRWPGSNLAACDPTRWISSKEGI